MVLVHAGGQEAQDALVATEFSLEGKNCGGIDLKLQQLVEARGLLLDGIGQFPQSPRLLMHDFATVVFEDAAELLNCFRYLLSR